MLFLERFHFPAVASLLKMPMDFDIDSQQKCFHRNFSAYGPWQNARTHFCHVRSLFPSSSLTDFAGNMLTQNLCERSLFPFVFFLKGCMNIGRDLTP
ncbi:hypothetical protein CDAR_103411 [Caerostris darwini]|uniref:Uncharacterized protein n=1 Tax=Caerostris darwini TaxID=1538125 RepID=A0AAV4WC53_9ARAC|nr:hypothetical protein CDAR_103411 [Caerostris darwini]